MQNLLQKQKRASDLMHVIDFQIKRCSDTGIISKDLDTFHIN
jgi:hypothetical protein